MFSWPKLPDTMVHYLMHTHGSSNIGEMIASDNVLCLYNRTGKDGKKVLPPVLLTCLKKCVRSFHKQNEIESKAKGGADWTEGGGHSGVREAEGRNLIKAKGGADWTEGGGHGGVREAEGRDLIKAKSGADWTEGGGHDGFREAEGRDLIKAKGGADWAEGSGHGGVSEAEGRDQIEAKDGADGAA
ncbi:hypothetical protein ROHU_027603 [Labeo rohita]|uniref:Uncharacterized protein n=1 Tax=Labeo rohita TaxID=84645 RepID=A0A498MAI1_LABRO|nr:hypothetical protein ROHU_027603 [Labeo rohita]